MRRAAVLLGILLTLLPTAASAGPKVVTIPWDKLEQTILGERVTIRRPDVTFDGMAIRVNPSGLVVDVLRSSNPSVQHLGSGELPRASLTAVEMHHRRRYIRPLTLLFAIAVAEVVDSTVLKNHQSVGTAVAVGLGAGFGSQYLARRLSDSVTIIRIQN